MYHQRPQKTGLYDPRFEHDACGVGFVAHLKGRQSHGIIDDACELLTNMTHRGAVGSDKNSGDGAGILTTLPHRFLSEVAASELGLELPPPGRYAAGIVFLPQDEARRERLKQQIGAVVEHFGRRLLGWRRVPTDNSIIGPTALASEPAMEQLFVGAADGVDQNAFERKLYLIRKRATRELRVDEHDPESFCYFCSLSSRVIVHKGMLMPEQLFRYFLDLQDPRFETHIAMVHSRFSTNTFPSWDRAQPNRFMSHNGEINTLQGNLNKMRSREGVLSSSLFGEEICETFPIVEPDCSDSGNFDNVLELLLMSGRELHEAVMMMVPEAWERHERMPQIGRDMYEFMGCYMEPWDGPASIAFTDGRYIGAVLDRNGLRPSRYYVTDDDVVIMASEVGVLNLPSSRIRAKGRLQPGRMFLVNFEEGRIYDDVELKNSIAVAKPYGTWLSEQRIRLEHLADPGSVPALDEETILERLRLFGYSIEHLNLILAPMAEHGKEPLGSMGNDAALACLSEQPRLLFDYFKQLFAQVTNPPIDSIREDIIMSISSYIGPEGNLLEVGPEHAHRLQLDHPVLTNDALARLKQMNHRGWRARSIDITFPVSAGAAGLERCLRRIAREAEEAIEEGYQLVVLSDRAAGAERAPAAALAAVGAVHHHLIRRFKRTRIGIVLESGEPREVHHFCSLFGFGADAVNPYLAFEAIQHLAREGYVKQDFGDEELVERYLSALAYGMRKVFGKMGISTLESYKGAQIFEAVGLADEVVALCFAGTASRVQGVGFEELGTEALLRHRLAYPPRNAPIGNRLLNFGEYQWRVDGEKHMWDPESIANLQIAVKHNDRSAYNRFRDAQNQRSARQATLRGLMRFAPGSVEFAVPLEEVEPAESIMRRFATGAMSFGSISQEAHETLALAMNAIGGKSNTGEGGEMPERYTPLPDGSSKRSAIKQIASGRFGATIEYLTEADEIQIKMAQGAKPGEGGELPGRKVFEVIAKTRYSTPGVGLISPPPHHDIYSIEDLAQLIFDLKNANPTARISVKLVSEVGVGTVAAGVAKAHADHILISGHDGGTGASPLTGIKHSGVPWELGLAETHQTLVMNDLRSRVVLQTDGQLKTGRDVAIAALLGAEEFGFATSALVSIGCIMMRKCEKNTCPVGVATQDDTLRRKFTGRPEDVVAFFRFVAEDLREVMARLGFRRVEEMVGRTDLLVPDEEVLNWKSKGIDLSSVLTRAVPSGAEPRSPMTAEAPSKVICCIPQEHGIEQVLDRRLIERCAPAIERKQPVSLELPIANTDRAVGTMLSHTITKQHGPAGLPSDCVQLTFTGSAGQSFGAWLTHGVSFELEGDSNDYVGKGLSGGRIVVYPPRDAAFRAEENIIIGNVALYGALMGKAFFRGIAAERFCVRNSGAQVVVEGVGDHGCEYMTGGRAVILGPTGRNFAAGMSGGIAYVWDREGDFLTRLNRELVEPDELDEYDAATVADLLREHLAFTGSAVAEHVLENWEQEAARFVKVISPEFRRMLNVQRDTAAKEVVYG